MRGNGLKILIIDDESFARGLLTQQLSRLGFGNVVCHERASTALDRLETGVLSADLIFCDLQMPEMDGVEFVRHLVRIGFAGGLVLVSGEDLRILESAEKLARAHRLKVLGALHKPVSFARLKGLLERISFGPAALLGGRKAYDADEIGRAIDGGELVNHYQPKVDLATGEVVGVETLVRWRHRHDGMVYPDQFIGAAEENGLIDDLTRAVLVGALRDARRWDDEGVELHLVVNVSMDNLTDLDFPDFVCGAAASADFPLSRLMLEVTESRLMKDRRAALDILTRLRLRRVGLSIDDFGSGHSSLVQLRDIPFSELKVDRSFVHGASKDPAARAIVAGSLSMARELGMRTVGEGVEDRDDWEFLREAGCDLAQGWFIAKPMPAAELPDWVAEWELKRPFLAARYP